MASGDTLPRLTTFPDSNRWHTPRLPRLRGNVLRSAVPGSLGSLGHLA